ncbi:putative meiosis-specific protein SPO11 like protein [Cucumispora dikerogammari]|nr:putative meiosis-specific protein SPO11 like protein [Cucumispora dikerogammari]
MHPNYHALLSKIKNETLYLLKVKDTRFIIKLKFLEILKYMLKHNIKKSKREIFYTCPVIFGNQTRVDSIIKHYCATWQLEMSDINITISLKGIFIGRITFKINGEVIHQNQGLIPDMLTIETIEIKHKKILVVEKDSMMSFINEVYIKNKIKMNFVLVSGKGYPDTNTKNFLQNISRDKNIKIYGLFDFDPHGLDIYRVYKQTINIYRIGILSSDIFVYKVNEREMLKLKLNDFRKIESLISGENFIEFQEDLLFLKGLRKKCEIEIFTAFNEKFIINYLEYKLR